MRETDRLLLNWLATRLRKEDWKQMHPTELAVIKHQLETAIKRGLKPRPGVYYPRPRHLRWDPDVKDYVPAKGTEPDAEPTDDWVPDDEPDPKQQADKDKKARTAEAVQPGSYERDLLDWLRIRVDKHGEPLELIANRDAVYSARFYWNKLREIVRQRNTLGAPIIPA